MQNLIVAAIVLYACWYVLRRYLPKPLKRRMAAAVAAWCRDRGWHGVAMRMQPAGQVQVQGPASGCDSCSACAGAEKKGEDGRRKPTVQKISVDSLKRSLRR